MFYPQFSQALTPAEINTADMAAGSFFWKYTGKDIKFSDVIKESVISEKVLNWKEAEQRFFQRTKNSLNRRKRPSKGS